MAPKIKFTLETIKDRQTSRFHVRERVFHTRMQQTGDFTSPQELYSALEEGLRSAVQNVLQQDTDAKETDRLYFNIGSSRLESNYRSWGLTVKSWQEDPEIVKAGFAHLISALNSNESFTLDDSFTVNITRARPPVLGRGKTKGKAPPMKPGHKDSAVLVDRKHSIFKIKNKDEKCCARALATVKAMVENHEKLRQIKMGRGIQEDLAVQLHYAAKVPFGPCGIEELKKFQQALPDYRIVVVNVKENHQCISFTEEEKPILALEYNDGHFNVITSLKGYFRTSYFCPTCLKGYQDPTKHNCLGRTCIGCKQDTCQDFSKDKKPSHFCANCQRWFYGETCFENHTLYDRKGEENIEQCICSTVQRCQKCKKLEVGLKNIGQHQCGHTKCVSCGEYVDLKTHECFIQTGAKKKRSTKEKEIVCFDIEATQINGQHKANLIMAETMYGNEERTFYNLRDFINWVDELADDGNVEVTVIAHNLQGYDGYFVVDSYYESDQNIKQIRNGAKILYIGKDSLRYIDSMSFIAMPLAAFPKTFGLTELKKGYFPHLFNRPENYEYVGSVPAKDYYMPESMSVDGRKKFEAWHAKQVEDGYVFNFAQELHDYCRSDVRLLKEGCRVFMEKFQKVSSFNPFEKITIASACNRDLRENHLEENKIAVEPARGWFDNRNTSRVAREYLDLTQKKLEEDGMTLQHRDNGGEYQIPGTNFHVDGYCPETNTVIEFLGCYWHGCPSCFPNRSERHYRLADRSFHEVYKETQERLKTIRNLRYNVETIWECEWQKMKEDNPELKAAAGALVFIEPLNPRDAFSGGRTETFKLYAAADDADQPIGYFDYKSLYPWVNKTQRYPVGMPQQILNPDTTAIAEYFGLVKCKILAPYGLYLPVLPVKGEKLTFPLCQKCVEDQLELSTLQRSAVCHHTHEERSMVGTWCTPELEKAVEMGYEILKIYEVWHFPESEEGLFETYVNTWLKWKEEASGWSDDVVTEEEKEAYIQSYYAHEGILLDKDNIEFNAGMRAVAKIALNSMWGKFGQNDEKIHMIGFSDVMEYAKFMAKDSIQVVNISVVSDTRIEVFYKYTGEDQPINPHTNVFIAAFTTCYGRLRLYEALERAGHDSIYCDTDSIISKLNLFEGLTGPYLGQLQNELKADDFITEFVSGGPKNYGYLTKNGGETCKVKGFSLNSEGSTQMNYNLMKEFILNEVERPREKPRMKQILKTHQIVRDPKNYDVCTEPASKFYRLVFDKRVIDPITKDTLPYGYFHG